MNDRTAEVLVLGAGLQGTGIALELARRGVAVTLAEQDAVAMNRASLRNEGKIHLGFIYANDTTFATAARQLEGALVFREILARWIGPAADHLALSTPFHYLVDGDSVRSPAQLEEHYRLVESRAREALAADPSMDYLGTRPEAWVRRLGADELAARFDPDRFAGGFDTAELAVNTDVLAQALRAAVAAAPGLAFAPSHTARSIEAVHGGFVVGGDSPSGPWRIRARQVVNATWERRLAFDRQLGIAPPADLLHRLKYRVIARLPHELLGAPSVSMVLGRYGDVVVRPDGTAFLSWYPVGLRGWSHDAEPPAHWDGPCRGEVAEPQAREIAAGILAGIDAWYPGMGRAEPLQVDAGAIVAIGRTDVDDASSGLHDRTHIGVATLGGYHSVDPGKLTTAPLFALAAAERVEAFALGRALA